ncbi:MAG: amino acid ABC transporter ATP-binding protein [Lachnospiraceae bacterium]|nr:amino acid ABC transporter ATP-binding protein [Lachnospiraceae bacterium]
MIRIEHLKKEYPNTTPLKDVSTVINDGDVISVIGPSGTGKSTLLRSINMLEVPTSGHIWIDDVEITDPKCDLEQVRNRMGMVFQSFNLFGHMTVIENVMSPPIDLLGMDRQRAYDEGMRLLRAVGLSDKALNYPDELSGGQKQRIAIARTLAMDPDIILMDEPTSALDPTMVGEVQAVIRELAKTGKTLIIVTHEMRFAKSICNRVFFMDEGGIYEDGTPQQIFDAPVGEKTRRFVRGLKVLELDIQNTIYDFLGMQTAIEEYCVKNQMPYRMAKHIHLTFEETVQQNLIAEYEKPDIHVTIEYSEEEETAVYTLDYSGKKYDILSEGNELSVSVLKTTAGDPRYEWDETRKYQNRLVMNIL